MCGCGWLGQFGYVCWLDYYCVHSEMCPREANGLTLMVGTEVFGSVCWTLDILLLIYATVFLVDKANPFTSFDSFPCENEF